MDTTDPSKIKHDLNAALQTLLQGSFDADSKVCIVTMIKVLDNITQKPGNDKVRCIRISNPNFWQKVGQRKGALDYLCASGFVRTMEATGDATTADLPKMELDSDVRMGDAASTDAGFLRLLPDKEDVRVLQQARQQLVTCAIHELKIPAQDLPKFKPPPPMASAVGAAKRSAATAGNGGSNGKGFNIYQGSRYDGQAAATGMRTGPTSANYRSPTEQSLERLQQRQKDLESKIQPNRIQDREWVVYRPGKQNSAVSSLSTNLSAASAAEAGTSSDANLLAARAKQQMEQRDRAENAGFTTKAMRDLAKIKNQKVYSHATLQIQFPDGCWLRGKFLPTETIADLEQVLRHECLRPGLFQDEAKSIGIELYITPPRQVLKPPSSTIKSHGLMPAAKVFVSFTKPIASVQLASPGHFLNPDLIHKQEAQTESSSTGTVGAEASTTLFPKAVPIDQQQQQTSKAGTAAGNAKGGDEKKKKKSKRNKEEDMLKRMMGGFGKRK